MSLTDILGKTLKAPAIKNPDGGGMHRDIKESCVF
jgi:hypothetical protein